MFTAIMGSECSSESQVSTPCGLCTALTVIASAVSGMATDRSSASAKGRSFIVITSWPREHAADHGFFLHENALCDPADVGRLNRLDAVGPILDVGNGEADRKRGAVVVRELELVVLLVGVFGDEPRLGAFKLARFGRCCGHRV